jgi:quercetin dioxygenase-like cupin family protein
VQTVRSVYPAHEHEQFIAHLRGLVTFWVDDETTRLRS